MFTGEFMGLPVNEQVIYGFIPAAVMVIAVDGAVVSAENNYCPIEQPKSQQVVETQPVVHCPAYVQPAENIGGSGIILTTAFASVAVAASIKRRHQKNKS